MAKKEETRLVRTVCPAHCGIDACGILAHVKGDRVIKVEPADFPESKYRRICLRGLSSLDITYHHDRLKYPMKRIGERGEGKFERISWDEAFVDRYLPGRVEKERLTEEQARQARENIKFTSSLEEAVKDADYVIEAIIEFLDAKRKLFADLDKMAPPHAILATNSSRIVSSRIADVTYRPDKVVNLHFFNPALVMKLVEVVQGPHTSDETAKISLDLCDKLDKVSVYLKKEVDGFLLNRIFGAIAREAQWLLEMEIASYEDIDKACVYGAGHPMGPFRLMDLTGIDLAYTQAMEAFKATGDRSLLPTPKLVERYLKGEYGEKAGKGWYDYSEK